MANNSINLATLDFATIKENLKNHMRGQDIFRDYDFDGSNISALLNVLAYNTSLQAFYVNMLASESFLDSAQLRSSVISHAKELNYLPRSARSAKATINIEVEQAGSDTLIIPKGTSFTSTYNSQTYTFTTSEAKSYYSILDESTNTYSFETGNVDIYEGFYVTETFVINYQDETQRFILSNANIDTSSIIVASVENNGSSIINYTFSETLLGLNSSSKKYFLQASESEQYEIIFGDDIIGRRPPDGATITIQYRIASGTLSNGASQFVSDGDLTSDSSGRVTVTTITNAVGGAEAESIASIKYNAPRHFQSQERAITSIDYENILKAKYPEINAISVYGGETVEPPQYGRVFISLSISDIDGIPDSKIREYTSFIKPKMANPLQPVFVAPTYLYARIDTNVKYNLNTTTLKPDEVRLLVAESISDYNSTNLNDFNSTLYESRLVEAVNDSHDSILSNVTNIHLYKKLNPSLGVYQNFDISYGVALRGDIPEIAPSHPATELRTVYSSPFIHEGVSASLEDDGVGNIRIVSFGGDTYSTIKNVGTVTYSTGRVQLNNFLADSYSGQSIRIYALPANRDIKSSFSDIFRIESGETIIKIETVRE